MTHTLHWRLEDGATRTEQGSCTLPPSDVARCAHGPDAAGIMWERATGPSMGIRPVVPESVK
jgi:hypothetical protein